MSATSEAARLAALRSLNVSATRQSIFQAIASCAAYACEVPVAGVCFAARQTMHVQASVGLPAELSEYPREGSVCEVALESGELAMVADMQAGPHAGHPAAFALNAGLCASMPIVLSNGIAVGTVFALDIRKRVLTETQRKALSAMRDEVVRLLEDRVTGDLRPEYVDALENSTTLTSNGIAVYVLEPGAQIPSVEYSNRAIAFRGGVPIEAFRGDLMSFFALGRNRALLDEAIARARSGDATSFDFELTAAAGHTYWVEAQIQPLKAAAPGQLRFMVITRDITERKREEAYRKLLAATVEKEPDGVFIARVDSRTPLYPEIVYANDGFCRLTGYALEDLGSARPRLFGPKTNREAVDRCTELVLAGEAIVEEIQLYRKNGEAFWAEVHAHPLDSPARHCVIIVRDITERHLQRERLRLMSAALEEAGDFIVITDASCPSSGGPHILYANKSFAQALGRDDSWFAGKTWTDIVSPKNDPKVWVTLAQRIERREPNYKEFFMRRADGTDFWVEFIGRPFDGESDGASYRIAVGRDITLRKRAADQISLLFAAIEESRDPTIIYERDERGDLVPVFENARAQAAGRHRLVDLLESPTRGAQLSDYLLSGAEARQIFADIREDGTPAVVEFSARALQGKERIEAAITVERTLAQGDPSAAHGYRSRLLNLSTMLPAIAEASSTAERFAILRALLLDTFGADVTSGEPGGAQRVNIDAGARRATFTYAGLQRVAQWPAPLEDTAITALRFCIEAAIEHEENRAGPRF